MIAESLSPEISIKEVITLYPGAQRALFRLYHIGGCASCGIQVEESLAQLCMRNGLDAAEVVKNLIRAQAEDEQLTLTPAELSQLLEQNRTQNAGDAGQATPPIRLLDIRTREEFEAVHLADSILFTQELMNEIMNHWPREELLVILDHRGARSLDAAAYFAGHGFMNVKSLRGGIDAWAEQVDPSLPRYTVE